jgi:hypothetical protein
MTGMLLFAMLVVPTGRSLETQGFERIADRDYNLIVRWGEDSGVLWIAHDAVDRNDSWRRPGVVRLTDHSGRWELHRIRRGEATFARFQTSIDLSGWLPMWLARSGVAKELPAMFQGMRELVAQTTLARRQP